MDTATVLAIISIIVAIVIGIWQIQLARKQIQSPKEQPNHVAKHQKRSILENKNKPKLQEREREKNKKAFKTDNHKPEEKQYREQPYPGEIFNLTNQLPLIQRHEARNKYQGLKVKWRGIIKNLYLENDNLVALNIRVDDHDTLTYVYCKVKISDYPEVKIAQDGHGVWVYGEIRSIGNADIELTNCKIELD